MKFYRWIWLGFTIFFGCGESAVEVMKDEIASVPSTPQIRLHRADISDDLWGPDALTDSDGIYIEWEPNSEIDLAGYVIYRSTTRDEGYERVGSVSEARTFYEDLDVKLETKYHYRITAVDEAQNESRMSEVACYTLLRKPVLMQPPNQAVLDALPTFRWIGIGESGFYTVRVFVATDETENPLREIWRYETLDFDDFEAVYNHDGTATESLRSGQEYRWRVDFEEREAVGSESTWHFFRVR